MLGGFFNRFMGFSIKVLCLDRFAGNTQLQDFNLLLAIENLIRKENFYQHTYSAKADPCGNGKNHDSSGAQKRFHDHAAYSWLGIRLLWLIPSHIALIADLVEHLVGSFLGRSAGHDCDERADSLAEEHILPWFHAPGWVKDESAKNACEFGCRNLLRWIRSDQKSLIFPTYLIMGEDGFGAMVVSHPVVGSEGNKMRQAE